MVLTFRGVVDVLLEIMKNLVVLVIALSVVVFLWGLAGYIKKSGDVSGREESRKYIIYGLLGLFVMASIWGLVSILTNTFGFGSVGIPQIVI